MRNFLAVGDEPVEIIFDAKGGITLIRGNNEDVSYKSSNGSGKSTIIEGIFFGLTGSTLRKLNGPAIIHNSAASECRVEIEYDDVKIVRTLKRQAKTVKSGVEFHLNGVEKTTPSVPETNKLIDANRGVNFETLSNILIFGQHNIVSFLDAGEPEKREIIENLMNLREYNQYEQIARDKLKESKASLKGLIETHTLQSGYLAEQTKLIDKQKQVLAEYQCSLTVDIRLWRRRSRPYQTSIN
jgi:exonuclease SbcC